jgi:hypothetical protein
MALLTEIEFVGVSALQYEQTSAATGIQQGNLPTGMLCHVAIVTESGLRLTNLWNTRQEMEAFGKIMHPAAREAGFPPPLAPSRITEIYNFDVARR